MNQESAPAGGNWQIPNPKPLEESVKKTKQKKKSKSIVEKNLKIEDSKTAPRLVTFSITTTWPGVTSISTIIISTHTINVHSDIWARKLLLQWRRWMESWPVQHEESCYSWFVVLIFVSDFCSPGREYSPRAAAYAAIEPNPIITTNNWFRTGRVSQATRSGTCIYNAVVKFANRRRSE